MSQDLDIQRVLLAAKLPRFAHMAKFHENRGEYTQADYTYQSLGAALQQIRGETHLDVGTTFYQLARLNAENEFEHAPQTQIIYNSLGRNALVDMLYRQALDIRRNALGADHRDVAESLYGLAAFQCRVGQVQAALPLLQQALSIQEHIPGNDHPDVTLTLNALAAVHWAGGDRKAALPFLTRALEVHRRHAQKQPILDGAANLRADVRTRLDSGSVTQDDVAKLMEVKNTNRAHMADAYFEMTYEILGTTGVLGVLEMVLDVHYAMFTRRSRTALAATLNALSDVHQALGDRRASLACQKEAVEVQRTLV